jgi:hypothetical protein
MKRNLLEVYALAACLAAVIIVVVSVAMSSYEALRIVAPSVTIPGYEYERSLSDDLFLQARGNLPVPQPSEIPRLRKEAFDATLRTERHDGLRSFLQSLMYTMAAGLVFWLHWRLALREREISRASAA